ncbi:MAG: macro domain-containing protein [Anaerolineae bacterium]|nr:macro domain-containing protein [Anaerolineae bacterium]
MKAKVNKVTIETLLADLWLMPVATAVHATDTELSLTPTLAAKFGTQVIWELEYIGYCPVGEAVITSPGESQFEKIIHAVGPRWGEGSERGKLAGVTYECLRLAEENNLKSLAMPAISTGALGYPLENCATTMLGTIIDYSFEDLKHLRRITLCLQDAHALEVFDREFARQLAELRDEDANSHQAAV